MRAGDAPTKDVVVGGGGRGSHAGVRRGERVEKRETGRVQAFDQIFVEGGGAGATGNADEAWIDAARTSTRVSGVGATGGVGRARGGQGGARKIRGDESARARGAVDLDVLAPVDVDDDHDDHDEEEEDGRTEHFRRRAGGIQIDENRRRGGEDGARRRQRRPTRRRRRVHYLDVHARLLLHGHRVQTTSLDAGFRLRSLRRGVRLRLRRTRRRLPVRLLRRRRRRRRAHHRTHRPTSRRSRPSSQRATMTRAPPAAPTRCTITESVPSLVSPAPGIHCRPLARSHDRTTARPLDRSTARSHDRPTARTHDRPLDRSSLLSTFRTNAPFPLGESTLVEFKRPNDSQPTCRHAPSKTETKGSGSASHCWDMWSSTSPQKSTRRADSRDAGLDPSSS